MVLRIKLELNTCREFAVSLIPLFPFLETRSKSILVVFQSRDERFQYGVDLHALPFLINLAI